MPVYSELSPIVFKEVYFQENMHSIAAGQSVPKLPAAPGLP